MGEIVTFYSYNGGTGRTMALANVAWILASAGHRVLMVDWDLEAPGLHRYFHPFLRDRELITSQGIIDIVIDFAVQATTPASTDEEHKTTWYLPLADVLRHAMSIDWDFGEGQLDLLPAGQQTAAYATRVNSFNWDNFYERLGGGTFLDALRASMMANYDYVLIDSRTGVSDTSGICTVQLPETVVICFTLNRQSIEGAAATAGSIVSARAKTLRGSVRMFPVPTRVEKAETAKLEAARASSRERFRPFLSLLTEEPPAKYWDEIEIPYQAYYAYEEVLASFHDPSPSVGSVLYSMERLAARLTGKVTIEWTQPADDRRSSVLGGYSWIAQTPPSGAPPPAAPGTSPGPALPEAEMGPVATAPIAIPPPRAIVSDAAPGTYWFYVSFAVLGADAHLEQFVKDLEEEIRSRTRTRGSIAFFDRDELKSEQVWRRAIVEGVMRSRVAICLISPAYLYSETCGREFSLFRQLNLPIVLVPWVPVQTPLPEALTSIETPNVDIPSRLLSSGVQAMLRIARYRSEYQEYLDALAIQVLRLGQTSPTLPARETPRLEDLPNAFSGEWNVAAAGAFAVFACIASGGWAWRPYESRSLRELAQRAAAEERFYFSGIEVASSLPSDLRRVNESGQLWVVLVDTTFSESGFVIDVVGSLESHSLGRVLFVQPSTASSWSGSPSTLSERLGQSTSSPIRSEDELVETIRRELLSMRAEIVRAAATRSAQSSVTLPTIVRHE